MNMIGTEDSELPGGIASDVQLAGRAFSRTCQREVIHRPMAGPVFVFNDHPGCRRRGEAKSIEWDEIGA